MNEINNNITPLTSLQGNVSKLAVPNGTTLGVLTDIFSPLAPIAPILLLLFVSLSLVLVMFLVLLLMFFVFV